MIKKIIFFSFFSCFIGYSCGQTENVLRINFLNPSLTIERALKPKTTFETGVGFGYNGSYPDLAFASESGIQYIYAGFVDLQSRYYYNLEK
jgi:hypothetical protein